MQHRTGFTYLGVGISGFALLVLATFAEPGLAVAPPSVPPWYPAVEKLIAQMGERDYSRREEAERKLAAETPRILPLLRTALGSPDPEIRRRALRLYHTHETSVLFAPKLVTLKVVNKPTRVIAEEIAKQTGYKIQFFSAGGSGEVNYSYDFNEVPFWEAIDRLCRDANLVLQPNYGDDTVRLQSSSGYAGHVGRDGAFRYVANSFNLYRNVELGLVSPKGETTSSRSENLNFSFTLHAEPRLPILGLGEIRLEAAYDNEKNSLLMPRNEVLYDGMGGMRGMRMSRYYSGGNKQLSMQTQVALHRVSEKATTLSLLRGVVPLTVLVEQKGLVVTDKILEAKGKKFSAGDVQFSFEDIKKLPNNHVSVQMTITNNNKENPGDYTWMNTLYQRIELTDDKGNKYQVGGSSWGGSGTDHVQMTLTYNPTFGKMADPPTKFLYQQWITRQHDVNFEFRNLPLP